MKLPSKTKQYSEIFLIRILSYLIHLYLIDLFQSNLIH